MADDDDVEMFLDWGDVRDRRAREERKGYGRSPKRSLRTVSSATDWTSRATAVVSDFDFSVEKTFFETGGAGDEECEAGEEACEVGAGLETACGWANCLPGTNSNAFALSLLIVRRRQQQQAVWFFLFLFLFETTSDLVINIMNYLDAANALLASDISIHRRIARFYQSIDEHIPDNVTDDVQLETARCASSALVHVQRYLDTDDAPPIATRDLATLRTLLTLLFQWGIHPRIHPASTSDISALESLLAPLVASLFPRGLHAQPAQTLITTTILQNHVPDLLRAVITPPIHSLRPSVLRLLELCVSMCSTSAQLNLNPVLKHPSAPDNVRSRRNTLQLTTTPGPCPQTMLIAAHKESAPSGRCPSSLYSGIR